MRKITDKIYPEQVAAAMLRTPAHSLYVLYRDKPSVLLAGQLARIATSDCVQGITQGMAQDVELSADYRPVRLLSVRSVALAAWVDYRDAHSVVVVTSVDDASPQTAAIHREAWLIHATHCRCIDGDLDVVIHVLVEREPPYAVGVYRMALDTVRDWSGRSNAGYEAGISSVISVRQTGGSECSYTCTPLDI